MCENFHNKMLGEREIIETIKGYSFQVNANENPSEWLLPCRLTGVQVVHSVGDNYISLNPNGHPPNLLRTYLRILTANTHFALFPGCRPHSAVVTERIGAQARGECVASSPSPRLPQLPGKDPRKDSGLGEQDLAPWA